MSYFNVENKIKEIKKALNESIDFSYRFYKKNGQIIGFAYLKSIIDQQLFSSAIYYTLQLFSDKITIDSLKNDILKCVDIKEIKQKDILKEILDGRVVLLTNFSKKLLSIDLLKFPIRTPTEPPTKDHERALLKICRPT